jgi:phenylalanyl-tRNA synthetase alpha chain
MTDLLQDLEPLLATARIEIANSTSLSELDSIRVRLLGKSGELTAKLKMLGSLDPDARRAAGAKINVAKESIGVRRTQVAA